MVGSEGNVSLKNPVTPPGIDSGTVRLAAQCLNHYATPGPNILYVVYQILVQKSEGENLKDPVTENNNNTRDLRRHGVKT